MIDLNKILIRRISKNDLQGVIDILQDISVYTPPKIKHKNIWIKYSKQKNVFGYCFFYEKKLIGFGSLNFEMKLKKGLMAYLEDIVVHREFRGKKIGKLINKTTFNRSDLFVKEASCFDKYLQIANTVPNFANSAG